MQSTISTLITEHKKMLNRIEKSTGLLYRMALNQMFTELAEETENRQRLISIVDHLQSKIELEIDSLNPSNIPRALIQNLNTWKAEFIQTNFDIRQIDKKIVDLLTQNKDALSKEIAHVFKDRELFKGYNLTNVKR